MKRKCSKCGAVLSQYNPGKICQLCQKKQLKQKITSFEQKITSGEDLIDAEGYAAILGLDNPESVKRLARKGKLATRIPGIRKYFWNKEAIDTWIKQEGISNKDFRKTAGGIAGNLRRCSNDSIIYCHSHTIEDRVYGVEPIMGTTASGRIEPVELVKVDRSVALKVLKQLPGEDFPELSGITDWGDLAYDRISEDLIVRLEAYF